MSEYFDKIKGGMTIYYGSEGASDVRFMLLHHGEDVELATKAFWGEHRGDFVVVPLICHGHPPRKALCSARSLAAAVQTATIPVGGTFERDWKQACEMHQVAWPKRLQAA